MSAFATGPKTGALAGRKSTLSAASGPRTLALAFLTHYRYPAVTIGSCFMRKTCYVAEIDENGRIVCVWVKPKEKRNACVFDPKKHIFDLTKDADYFGAKPMAIKSWLAAKRMDGSFNG